LLFRADARDSTSNWEHHLRRQYLMRAPDVNPFGTAEAPLSWAALSLTNKVRPRANVRAAERRSPPRHDTQVLALHSLCEWQLVDAERFRKLVKSEEEPELWVRLAVVHMCGALFTLASSASTRSAGMGRRTRTGCLMVGSIRRACLYTSHAPRTDNRLWVQHPPPAPKPKPRSRVVPKKGSKRARVEAARARKAAPTKSEAPLRGTKRARGAESETSTPSKRARGESGGLPRRGTRGSTAASSTPAKRTRGSAAAAPTSARSSRRLRGPAEAQVDEGDWEEVPSGILESDSELSDLSEPPDEGDGGALNGEQAEDEEVKPEAPEASAGEALSNGDHAMHDAADDVKTDEADTVMHDAAPNGDAAKHEAAEPIEEDLKSEPVKDEQAEEATAPAEADDSDEWIEFETVSALRARAWAFVLPCSRCCRSR
jgi:hypothetical protein